MSLLYLALLLAADPAATTLTATAEAPKKPKLICKTITMSGSRLGGKKICSSALGWERNGRDSRDLGQEIIDTNIRVPYDNG